MDINVRITPTSDGGFDLTPTSGIDSIVLVETQPGDENFAPTERVEQRNPTRASARVDFLPVKVVVTDGQAHHTWGTTSPASLPLAVRYFRDGKPGFYRVEAEIACRDDHGQATSNLESGLSRRSVGLRSQ